MQSHLQKQINLCTHMFFFTFFLWTCFYKMVHYARIMSFGQGRALNVEIGVEYRKIFVVVFF